MGSSPHRPQGLSSLSCRTLRREAGALTSDPVNTSILTCQPPELCRMLFHNSSASPSFLFCLSQHPEWVGWGRHQPLQTNRPWRWVIGNPEQQGVGSGLSWTSMAVQSGLGFIWASEASRAMAEPILLCLPPLAVLCCCANARERVHAQMCLLNWASPCIFGTGALSFAWNSPVWRG